MLKQAIVLVVAAGSLIPRTSEDQAFLAILADTKVGRMAGMPMMDLSQLPPGIKLPPQAMMFSGQATRVLNIRLWSPTLAPAGAKASVAPPAGLKQGPKLDLELYRPTGNSGEQVPGFNPDADPQGFTIKIYWGSSETVKDGQPKIFHWGDLTPEQREAMKDRARDANPMSGRQSYFYKPNWTTGYWPNKNPGQIDKEASLVGKYSLTTDYTGNVDIDAPANVNFLAPIEMSSPNLEKSIDLKKSISFAWKEIPNALGLNAMIFGMEGKNSMTIWTSSEVYAEGLMGDMGFLQMAQVRDFVDKTIFMAGTRKEVKVPAGIFATADMAMMQMAGYGPGAALDQAQPLPRIQTKTSLMLMLGGKKMQGG